MPGAVVGHDDRGDLGPHQRSPLTKRPGRVRRADRVAVAVPEPGGDVVGRVVRPEAEPGLPPGAGPGQRPVAGVDARRSAAGAARSGSVAVVAAQRARRGAHRLVQHLLEPLAGRDELLVPSRRGSAGATPGGACRATRRPSRTGAARARRRRTASPGCPRRPAMTKNSAAAPALHQLRERHRHVGGVAVVEAEPHVRPDGDQVEDPAERVGVDPVGGLLGRDVVRRRPDAVKAEIDHLFIVNDDARAAECIDRVIVRVILGTCRAGLCLVAQRARDTDQEKQRAHRHREREGVEEEQADEPDEHRRP